jgi:hypothetical protein
LKPFAIPSSTISVGNISSCENVSDISIQDSTEKARIGSRCFRQ